MLKKIWTIFIRDLKVNTRETITLFILVIPLVLSVGINLITPGINDTTINVALVNDENKEQAEYFDKFAHVELLGSAAEVEDRVMQRDSVLGLIRENKGYVILAQGNEPKSVVDYTKVINALSYL